MLRKFEYTDILGWSVSRYDTFSNCKRQYYYQYYGKHDPSPEITLLRLNILKNLTSIPLEIGNVSHKVIKTLLDRIRKTDSQIDEERFFEYVRRTTKQIVESKQFTEIYYKEKDEIDYSTDILSHVENSMKNFLKSERLQWIFKEALENKTGWIIDPDGFGECRIDNLKAYCKVDFLFPVGEKIHIIDWKTGKEAKPKFDEKHDKHGRQMRGYVVWAHFQLEKDYENILPTVAYLLPEYKERDIRLNEFDIEDFADSIRTETEEMYEYCEDVESNMPKEKDFFKMTENLNSCKFCSFRELCKR